MIDIFPGGIECTVIAELEIICVLRAEAPLFILPCPYFVRSILRTVVIPPSPSIRRAAAEVHGEFDNDVGEPGCTGLWLSRSAERNSFACHLPLPCSTPP